MSREWSALWLPPTEVHAEAESENHAENIGNVFVHRPQEPIPNSWHITRQGYSKDRPADSFFVDHWPGDSFLSCYIWLLTFTFFKTYGLWLILQYFEAVYIFSPAVYINITFAFVSKTLLILTQGDNKQIWRWDRFISEDWSSHERLCWWSARLRWNGKRSSRNISDITVSDLCKNAVIVISVK